MSGTDDLVEMNPEAAEKCIDTPECENWLERKAALMARIARDNAPVRTGDYQASLTSGSLETEGQPAAWVGSDGSVNYWRYIEYGDIDIAPLRVITNAVAKVADSTEIP